MNSEAMRAATHRVIAKTAAHAGGGEEVVPLSVDKGLVIIWPGLVCSSTKRSETPRSGRAVATAPHQMVHGGFTDKPAVIARGGARNSSIAPGTRGSSHQPSGRSSRTTSTKDVSPGGTWRRLE